MNLPLHTIRLFQRALLWWTLGWALWMLVMGLPAVAAGIPAIVPKGWFACVTHALARVPADMRTITAGAILAALVATCVYALLRGLRWWLALLIALLFHNMMHAAWLLGHGGLHLMANLLLWNVLLTFGTKGDRTRWLAPIGFWAVRLQLLMVYAVTVAYKVTGVHWLDGTAVGIVATDPGFGGTWLLAVPGVAALCTWAALVWQAAFPLMVWWRPTRRVWLVAGAVFHLLTSWWIGVPEMGLAFIAAYAIWLSDGEARGRAGGRDR